MYRRQILKAIPALWLTAPAIAIGKSRDQEIDEAAADLTKRLQEFHGGKWVCKRDNGLLMVQRV